MPMHPPGPDRLEGCLGDEVTLEAKRLALAMDAAQMGSWTWDMASGVTTSDERLEGQPPGTTGVAIDVTMREQLVQTFKRALLPTSLPTVPGTTVAARYRSAERRHNVGSSPGEDDIAVLAVPLDPC
jgi:hypothetical protein